MNRRQFIGSLGLTFALPQLEVFGSTTTDIKRLAVVYVPNGINMSHWTPSGYGDIIDIPNTLSPLQDHLKETQVISGLTHDKARANGDGAGDHARAASTFLTGKQAHKHESKIRSGKSVDQHIADKYNGVTRFDSLQITGSKSRLVGKCDSGYSCAYQYNLSWKNAQQPMAAMHDPQDIFNRLFNVKTLEQKQLAQKKSILDFVLEESKTLEGKLPASDKVKLDEYMYAVREVEKDLQNRERFRLDKDFEFEFKDKILYSSVKRIKNSKGNEIIVSINRFRSETQQRFENEKMSIRNQL